MGGGPDRTAHCDFLVFVGNLKWNKKLGSIRGSIRRGYRNFLDFHLMPDFESMSNAPTAKQNSSRFQQAMQAILHLWEVSVCKSPRQLTIEGIRHDS